MKNLSYRDLPLLYFTQKNLCKNADFNNTFLFGVQHLCITTYELFRSLIDLGFKPENIALIGKCYSTYPKAFKALKDLKIDICMSSLTFDSHQSFKEQFKRKLKDFFLKKDKEKDFSTFDRVIMLDDGGNLLKDIISELNFKLPNLIGIEQTSSGYNSLKKQKKHFSIINVARSNIKLKYESPLIARLVVDRILHYLSKIVIQKTLSILIIGKGAIGEAVSAVLRKYYSKISFFDLSLSKSSFSETELNQRLKDFDIIIGCTGETSIYAYQYSFLKKNVILISASSSDIEFEGHKLRKLTKKLDSCHESLFVNNINLVNCGFPINFDSDFEEIDPNELELTRSILLSAIKQASKIKLPTVKNTFIPLNSYDQKKITEKYLFLYKK